MCSFKPGDEVVTVHDDSSVPVAAQKLTRGRDAIYVVAMVLVQKVHEQIEFGLVLVGEHSGHPTGAYASTSFRKVQRRDLSAWLKASIGNTDKLDKRQTKKVHA